MCTAVDPARGGAACMHGIALFLEPPPLSKVAAHYALLPTHPMDASFMHTVPLPSQGRLPFFKGLSFFRGPYPIPSKRYLAFPLASSPPPPLPCLKRFPLPGRIISSQERAHFLLESASFLPRASSLLKSLAFSRGQKDHDHKDAWCHACCSKHDIFLQWSHL